MDNMELEHHGVKGMHWGVRRTPEQLGRKIQKLEKKNQKIESKINNKLYERDRIEAKAFNAKSRALRKGSRRASKKADKEVGKLMNYDSKIYKMRFKVAANGEKIDSFQRTITSLDSGTIKKGKGFVMQYMDGDYQAPQRIGTEDTNWLIRY